MTRPAHQRPTNMWYDPDREKLVQMSGHKYVPMRMKDEEFARKYGWAGVPIRTTEANVRGKAAVLCVHEYTCCIECIQDWALDYDIAWDRTVGGRALRQAILDRYATDPAYERVEGVPDPADASHA